MSSDRGFKTIFVHRFGYCLLHIKEVWFLHPDTSLLPHREPRTVYLFGVLHLFVGLSPKWGLSFGLKTFRPGRLSPLAIQDEHFIGDLFTVDGRRG